MLIAGWQKMTLIDYPDKIASIIFTQGCNLECFYCHNSGLIDNDKKNSEVDETKIFEYLNARRKFIDGVVVTGGEPTLQNDLKLFLNKIKRMGLLVKLDTNGTKPNVLSSLIKEQLVDYVAMDVKAPIDKYHKICGDKLDYSCIRESISIIKKSGIAHEFRTTLAKMLNVNDVKRIKEMVGVSSNLFAQRCNGNFEQIPITDIVQSVPQIKLRGF